MKKRLTSMGISILVVVALFGMMAPVQAQEWLYTVQGTVYYPDMTPVEADVTVTVTDIDMTHINSTLTDTTSATGYYQVIFGFPDMNFVTIGDQLQLEVTIGPCFANTTTVEATQSPKTVDLILQADDNPPTITDLMPADGSCVTDRTPEICADYNDAAGINTSSVTMKVGGDDVTVAPSETGVCYTPGDNLDDGEYTVMVNVSDVCGNPNSTSWSFTVDTTPPAIEFNKPPTPVNNSEVTVNYVNVSVNVTDDGCGIDNATVVMTWNETADQMVEYMFAFTEGKYSLNMTDLPNGEHTYWVQANDTAGNMRVSETRFVTVNVTKVEYNFTIGFVTGYNMISMPVNDTTVTNASALLDKLGGNCIEIYKWNVTLQSWESYNAAMLPEDAFDIEGGEGYFVRMSGDTDVKFTGMGWESPFDISLVSGYNMIGMPVNDPLVTNGSALVARIGGNCQEVFKWNKDAQSWVSNNPQTPPADAFDIVGGEGYFVRMSGDADVTFTGEPWEN